ncbi:two-component system sensor histidine kinase EnvZ [Pleionea sp. CnH1-48]|uniref:two-component system sensor histidine kinase EnvZ n=1 Tax=Pleionea sp. CnH1-48 TaxID=2954494 RepID=UPI00209724D9|nr:two-component system sensor histidine kinase EnvZ [Pleionea sp. CnH1-48]MCO7226220.1 two-component system sensor histidine kinase EnvZ [Pleionea sp. CnH1-48]
MRIFPQGAFGRTALLIAGLLFINLIVYLFVTAFMVVQPNNEILMRQLANQINTIVLHEQDNVPDSVRHTFEEITGITAHEFKEAQGAGLDNALYYASLSHQLAQHLGEGSELRIEESDMAYYWILHPKQKDIWIRIPSVRIDYLNYFTPVVYLLIIFVLSLLGGWLFAKQLHRPLKRLELAAREIGRGDYPGQLKEQGAVELRAVTKAFNQMARDVHQLEEDRTLLLAGISHDLRTPITRIRLASEFLGEAEEETKNGIISDTEDMDAIIDQFISFVRDGRDEANINIDLNELIEQIAELNQLHQRDVRTHLQEIPLLPVKPLAMKRLIGNLIENSFRYGEPPVEIYSFTEDDSVVISIQDNGTGIPDLDMERLFQPFTRGEEARTGRGSGLGLAIVKRIVELHDGEILLRNRQQGGLEARLVFPTPTL